MIVLTREQRLAVFRVFQRDFPGWVTPTRREIVPLHGRTVKGTERVPSTQWRRFRKLVQPAFGDTCVMLHWRGMWLGIERDGYTHS